MSDEEKNKHPETDESRIDDDLESLSEDEKSAFEKIMSEIASAEGAEGTDSSEPVQVDAQSANTPEGSPERKVPPTDSEDQAPAAAGESFADGDDAPSAGDARAPEKDPPEKSPEENDEELTEDQQAALDKIMAEIEGQAPADQPPQPTGANPPDDADPDAADADSADTDDAVEQELSDEQQAALDKIMGEINGRKEADAPAEAEAAPDDDEAQTELSDEQQDALDKIMGEINGRKEADAPAEAEAAPDDDEAQTELSDEQQVALDKIMGEINDRKQADTPAEAEAVKEPSDDQQLAVAEVTPETDSNGHSADSDDRQSSSDDNDTPDPDLSIEEFNEELTHLLSSADSESATDDTAQKQIKKPQPKAPVDHAEGEPQEQPPPYAMLKEVADPDPSESSSKSKPKPKSSRAKSRVVKRVLQISAALSAVVALIALGAWAYHLYDSGRWSNPSKHVAVSESLPSSRSDQPLPLAEMAEPTPAAEQSPSPSDSPLALIRHDLENAREQLAAKKRELQDLKSYYQKGIVEEQTKVATKTASAKLTDFRAAMKTSQVELALRSIQRRMIYLKKLDTPLNQVDLALEQMLYWQRRTLLFEVLSSGISGLPISEFKQQVEQIIEEHLEKSRKLSIENIKVATPTLAAIWKELSTKKGDKRPVGSRKPQTENKDRAIGKEICNGNFEHLYLLSHVTDATAACLIQWSGKDLYLNELTHLSASAAQSLAQWPGERLSLNGIRALSAESAKHLSQWPGKWLSLNGLTRLSNEATAYLAQWQGEQLEMVGLNAIGRWENYVTRLYLSEQLKKKLDTQ
jgi:hypothetical protein